MKWRGRPELNWPGRCCRPLPYRSATSSVFLVWVKLEPAVFHQNGGSEPYGRIGVVFSAVAVGGLTGRFKPTTIRSELDAIAGIGFQVSNYVASFEIHDTCLMSGGERGI